MVQRRVVGNGIATEQLQRIEPPPWVPSPGNSSVAWQASDEVRMVVSEPHRPRQAMHAGAVEYHEVFTQVAPTVVDDQLENQRCFADMAGSEQEDAVPSGRNDRSRMDKRHPAVDKCQPDQRFDDFVGEDRVHRRVDAAVFLRERQDGYAGYEARKPRWMDRRNHVPRRSGERVSLQVDGVDRSTAAGPRFKSKAARMTARREDIWIPAYRVGIGRFDAIWCGGADGQAHLGISVVRSVRAECSGRQWCQNWVTSVGRGADRSQREWLGCRHVSPAVGVGSMPDQPGTAMVRLCATVRAMARRSVSRRNFSLSARLASFVRAIPALRSVRRLVRRPRWGNLKRNEPFSDYGGTDRGRSVHEVYIDHFIATHADAVRGRVLETADSSYTRRFGGAAVTDAEVLDIDRSNPQATVIADLGALKPLPVGSVDAFVMTQVLQRVPDPDRALRNAWDCLKPGGALLVTVPVVAKVEPGLGDLWRWTPSGLTELIGRALPDAQIQTASYGNLVALVASLYGMAAEDLADGDLDPFDPRFPVIAAARIDRSST